MTPVRIYRSAACMVLLLLLAGCSGLALPQRTTATAATAAVAVVIVPTVTPTPETATEAIAAGPAAQSTSEPTLEPTIEPTDTPVAETPVAETPVATDTAVAPTPEPTETSEPMATPTPEPTSTPGPTATPEPTATATPTPPRVALIRFRDSAAARSGDFTIISNGLPLAPLESEYDLWLTQGGQPAFRLGDIPSHDSLLNFSAGTELNLLARYDGALLSLETERSPSGELGPIVLRGSLPPNALSHIRHVVNRFEDNPNAEGFLPAAQQQLALAQEHAQFLRESLDAGDLAAARRHGEHVINILNGEAGEIFGDLDGDGVPQNPGDGIGVLRYCRGASQHAQLAADADDATGEIQVHAEHVQVSVQNMLGWLEDGVDSAVRILSADSVAEAGPAADALIAALDSAYSGVDRNGDGIVAPIGGEGGLLTAYEHALNMGSIELYPTDTLASLAPAGSAPAEQVNAAAAPADGYHHAPADTPALAPTVETPPTVTPTVTPAVAPTEAPAPSAVTIEMANFGYSQPQLTIPVGTVVTWVNRDGVQHSATADDGTFDTGLFAPGESASVLFNVPGTYPYYCELHGSPGGQGMSGVITVQ